MSKHKNLKKLRDKILRILGIDPGFAIVGFGVLDYLNPNFKVLSSGLITTSKGEFVVRLKKIAEELEEVIEQFKPDHMAIEKLFFTTNQKTAIDVAQARGAILLTAAQKNLSIFEYTPLQIKQAIVGYGKAEKKQVITMVSKLLRLSEMPKVDDEADAIAVAICHAHSHREIRGNS
ncbi:crossover junction endodeoxyribonuclease RuvC [Clostridia bacterium]|nr:crossover junction endodeoxyribonuclease RuvC [Clostridia bacterium]